VYVKRILKDLATALGVYQILNLIFFVQGSETTKRPKTNINNT